MYQFEKMIKERDVEGLINFLDHKNDFFRSQAAKSLGTLGDVRAVDP